MPNKSGIVSLRIKAMEAQPARLVPIPGEKNTYDIVELKRSTIIFETFPQKRGGSPKLIINHPGKTAQLRSGSPFINAIDIASAIRGAIQHVAGKDPDGVFKVKGGNAEELRVETRDADELLGCLKEVRDFGEWPLE